MYVCKAKVVICFQVLPFLLCSGLVKSHQVTNATLYSLSTVLIAAPCY